MDPVFLFAALFVAAIAIFIYGKARRRTYLMSKYNDEVIVQNIIDEKVWQGMSKEQLIDSWGKPADIDHKVYKTKSVDLYKYGQTGKNRSRSKVTDRKSVV